MSSVNNKTLKTQKISDAARDRFHQFLILLAAGCLTTMTGGLVAPVLPEMLKPLQLDPYWAGTVVSIHALTSALFTPIMGVVADRIGKLKVMIPCLTLYALFGTITPFVQGYPMVLASRALLGVASGGVAAATIGLLGSMYEGEKRSRILGYATSVMSLSAIFFPLVGGWVGKVQWQHAFYLYGLSIPLVLAVAAKLKEPRRKQGESLMGDRAQLIKVITQPSVLRLYLFIGIAALIVYAVVIYTPIYLKAAIGADPQLNGFVLAIRLVGASVVSAFGASRLARKVGEKRAIALGFSLMAITLALIPLLTQLPAIVLAAIVFGSGFGLVTPNLYNLLADLAPEEVRASTLAIGTGFNSLGQFISPLILGPLWQRFDLSAVFYGTAAIAIAASFLSLAKRKVVV
jgi:MFS transporter, ACDE family, multidrug resistance protein